MSRATRLAKREADLASLEHTFRECLVVALSDAIGGAWGLFGQNDTIHCSVAAEELLSLGSEIGEARTELGLGPFELLERFKWYRALRGSNDLGEPKLAVRLLAEIEEESPAR